MNTERLKKLVNDLTFDYDRMSTSGKQTLDEIIQLMNADNTIKLKRVFVYDALTYEDEPCAGVVYLYPDQEWKSGDYLENYWHIRLETSRPLKAYTEQALRNVECHYSLILERSDYHTDDDTLSELARLESYLFQWISDENDECKVDLITFDNLCDKWAAFLKREHLPAEWDAQEAILHDDLTAAQRQFVTEFIADWEGLNK